MSLFRKRGDADFVDYTMLHKRGLPKVPDIPKGDGRMLPDGTLDLTRNVQVPLQAPSGELTSAVSTPSAEASAAPSFGSFFDAPTVSATESVYGSMQSSTPAVLSATSSSDMNVELNALKLKLDDLEYKLARLLERLDGIGSGSR